MEMLETLLAGVRSACAAFPDKRHGDVTYSMADIGLSAFSLFFRFCQNSRQRPVWPAAAALIASKGSGSEARMECVACGSAAVTERPERTAQGYRRFRCRDCGRQYNERSASVLNHTQYPSDVIALVVLWRLRYRLTLRDLTGMF